MLVKEVSCLVALAALAGAFLTAGCGGGGSRPNSLAGAYTSKVFELSDNDVDGDGFLEYEGADILIGNDGKITGNVYIVDGASLFLSDVVEITATFPISGLIDTQGDGMVTVAGDQYPVEFRKRGTELIDLTSGTVYVID